MMEISVNLEMQVKSSQIQKVTSLTLERVNPVTRKKSKKDEISYSDLETDAF